MDDLWNAGGATPKDEAARVKYAKEVAPKFLDALAARLGKDKFFFGAAEPQWADLWARARTAAAPPSPATNSSGVGRAGHRGATWRHSGGMLCAHAL